MSRIEIRLDMLPCCCKECPLMVPAQKKDLEPTQPYCVPLLEYCGEKGNDERLPDCPLRAIDDDGRRHSKWHISNWTKGTCDDCGHTYMNIIGYDFCPNCGAVMDDGPYEDLFPGPIYEDKDGPVIANGKRRCNGHE